MWQGGGALAPGLLQGNQGERHHVMFSYHDAITFSYHNIIPLRLVILIHCAHISVTMLYYRF